MRQPHASQGRPPPHCPRGAPQAAKTPSAGISSLPSDRWHHLSASRGGRLPLPVVMPRGSEAAQPSSCRLSSYTAPTLTSHRCCKKHRQQIPVRGSAHSALSCPGGLGSMASTESGTQGSQALGEALVASWASPSSSGPSSPSCLGRPITQEPWKPMRRATPSL